MIKNYLKIALRNLFKNKLYSFLNIVGLAIGIACCILIFFYVQNELSYDKYHEHSDNIHRIIMDFSIQDRTIHTATTTFAYGPMLKNDFAEIEEVCRFTSFGGKTIVQYNDITFYEDKFLWADHSLFDVFSFELIKGNPQHALTEHNTIVITEDMAKKYFGQEDPLGKNLRVNGDNLYMVTGVMKNIPQTSHFRPDFFASFVSLNLKPTGKAIQDIVGNINYYTYALLRDGTNHLVLGQKLTDHLNKKVGMIIKMMGGTAAVGLQPLTSIYLNSDRENEIERTGDVAYVYLFSGIGLFILLIACLNFMNLATARSANRAKEVGLRKVVGAKRTQLMKQFLGESTILTFLSLITALILGLVLIPVFRNIADKDLTAGNFLNPVFLLSLLALFALTSLIGGSYPAFFLSAFRPVEVIQGRLKRGAKSSVLRIMLVSLQFVVSIVLIIGTLIINDQLHYVRNKKLGYDKDHVITVRLRGPATQKRYEALKTEFLRQPNVFKASASGPAAVGVNNFSMYHATDNPANEMTMFFSQWVDEDFLDTYNIEMVDGRYFSKKFPYDPKESCVINEAAVGKLSWQENALGKEIEMFTSTTEKVKLKVVGVVKDYHFQSLHEEIQPLLLLAKNPFGNFSEISVRVKPDDIQETIAFMKSKWAEFDTKYPFEYAFVDDSFDALYRSEERLGKLFSYFTVLAIVIGCLGLFGLTSFTAEQRTKEIGIRKVLGASVPNIIFMLVREFTKWVFIAAVIAWPAGYYLMNSWLQNFSYRIQQDVWNFVLSACLAIVIALFTVSYRSIKASRVNPVDSLRYE